MVNVAERMTSGMIHEPTPYPAIWHLDLPEAEARTATGGHYYLFIGSLTYCLSLLYDMFVALGPDGPRLMRPQSVPSCKLPPLHGGFAGFASEIVRGPRARSRQREAAHHSSTTLKLPYQTKPRDHQHQSY